MLQAVGVTSAVIATALTLDVPPRRIDVRNDINETGQQTITPKTNQTMNDTTNERLGLLGGVSKTLQSRLTYASATT